MKYSRKNSAMNERIESPEKLIKDLILASLEIAIAFVFIYFISILLDKEIFRAITILLAIWKVSDILPLGKLNNL